MSSTRQCKMLMLSFLIASLLFDISAYRSSVYRRRKLRSTCGKLADIYETLINNDIDPIINGEEAQVGDWPFIAALFHRGEVICGGLLVSSRSVLTAAHCVNQFFAQDLHVQLGDVDLESSTETKHQERGVEKIYVHRRYRPVIYDFDIALLVLDSPAKLNDHVAVVCLPREGKSFAGKRALVAGWGITDPYSRLSQATKLQQGDMQVMSRLDCEYALYKSYMDRQTAVHRLGKKILCAFDDTSVHKRVDTCQGDSGGPLVYHDNSTRRFTAVGLTSSGFGCGTDVPSFFTDLAGLVRWIWWRIQI